jgi:hypothetical protein
VKAGGLAGDPFSGVFFRLNGKGDKIAKTGGKKRKERREADMEKGKNKPEDRKPPSETDLEGERLHGEEPESGRRGREEEPEEEE